MRADLRGSVAGGRLKLSERVLFAAAVSLEAIDIDVGAGDDGDAVALAAGLHRSGNRSRCESDEQDNDDGGGRGSWHRCAAAWDEKLIVWRLQSVLSE